MQSPSNQSAGENSLLTGKLTGNFRLFGPFLIVLLPIATKIQWVTAKFPMQRNREFADAYQGNFCAEQRKIDRELARVTLGLIFRKAVCMDGSSREDNLMNIEIEYCGQ